MLLRPAARAVVLPSGASVLSGGAGGLRGAGAGVYAEHQVEEGAGAQLVHSAVEPGLLQLARPRADPLVRGGDLIGRQISRPIKAALPESSAHRSTRAVFAAFSRRCFAFSGATSMTARASAARSPPGVNRPARPTIFASAARASPSDRYWVSRTISSALPRVMIPSASASKVAPRRVARCHAAVSSQSAAARDLTQRQGQLVPGELVHHGGHPPGPGLEPVLRVPPEHLRDRHQLAGSHIRLGPVKGAHQPNGS